MVVTGQATGRCSRAPKFHMQLRACPKPSARHTHGHSVCPWSPVTLSECGESDTDDTEFGEELGTEAETDVGTEAETETEAETDVGTEAETETEAETDSSTNPVVKANT